MVCNDIGSDLGSILLTVSSTDKPFDMMIRYQFEETGGGTLARIQVQGGGFYKMVGPLLARGVKKNVQSDLERLKGLLASGVYKES